MSYTTSNFLAGIMMAALALTACNTASTPATDNPQPTLTGRWMESVPGMPDMHQGFELADDGTATAIGTATKNGRPTATPSSLTGKASGTARPLVSRIR